MDAIRWDFPHELFVLGGLAGAYAIGVRGEVVPRWRLACFGGGLLLVLAASGTPLDSLATTSLLSAHLLQNVVLRGVGARARRARRAGRASPPALVVAGSFVCSRIPP